MKEAIIQSDIAGKEHWDGIYEAAAPVQAEWLPWSYGEQAIEHALLSEIKRLKPQNLLEVGCGDSTWLPHLARKTGLKVTGVDYSQEGCDLARQRLRANNIEGTILCADILRVEPEAVGQFDFVFSLGLVEHFSDLEGILQALLKFVRPGGVLFTEVPNLRSIHGLMVWSWQPALMAKHELISRRRMARAYQAVGLENITARYLGLFSLNIVAWEIYARWPKLVPVVVPKVRRLNHHLEYLLQRLRWFKGIAPLAPYVYAVGRKPLKED
ncbi:MAG TPA: class I SAM-dependent methyltransferase [Pyrinomonadaceae bacterium]|nr:class I SAM-dependent methyltransferase [Pyrinomonadaceae bacterium]